MPAVPGGSGTPVPPGDGGAPRKPHRARAIIIVLIVAIVLAAAGIGGFLYWRHTQAAAQQETQAQATTKKKTAAQPKTKRNGTEESTKPKVSEVTMTDFQCGGSSASRWSWSGGAMVSNLISCADDGYATDGETASNGSQAGGEGEYSFGLWTPALNASEVVHVSMLESGEKAETTPIVAATYGDDPAVFVIYAVKTKAVGTTPETVHLYAHEVNVNTGELGKRIDLKTEEDNLADRDQDYQYAVIGASDTRVAVQKTWHTEETFTVNGREDKERVDHAQVMALTHGRKTATTLQTFKDEGAVTSDSGGYQSVDMTETEVKDVSVYDTYLATVKRPGTPVSTKTYQLYSIDGNKKLVDVPETYCGRSYGCGADTIRRVGDDHWLFNGWMVDSTGAAKSVASIVGVSEDSQLDLNQFSDGTVYVQAVDFGDDYAKRIFLIDDDLQSTEVLDKDQWGRLLLSSGSFKGINYLTDEIYVQTTDEKIIVDRKGKSVGSFDLLPASEDTAHLDHTHMSWMLYMTDDGDYTVTRGQSPSNA
ncbi:zinc ribbon domain-containing protein [Bifidobacterium parmae]|uniref:Uncharacterized protein n=1 Tax=Bifidobacterium parmae TaxID=361854 RepID=A0A2N5J6H5_9BIFI|nr:zinc ribbon domain-containing protein [Bifidobacterium parmae]PLS29819.1 hypothetical protein Uis4E_0160 [Bifidobacterium parmae]